MFVVFIFLELGKLLAYKFGGFVFNNEPFTDSFAISEMIPNLLLIQSWMPFTDSLSFNYPSWSISIEFYMYALLFISIVAFKESKVIAWLAISLIAFFLIYLESDITVSKVLRGLSCFFGGAFTYVIYKKFSQLKLSYNLGSVIEAILLVLVVLIVQSKIEYRSMIAPILFFITVFFFSFEAGILSRFLKTKPLQYAGKLSYSIYMTHAAILFCLVSIAIILQKATGAEVAPMIEGKRALDFGSGIINNISVVSIIAIVIYASSLTYKYIELTGQKMNKSRTTKSKAS